MSHLIIKASTTDSEIAGKLTTEEILSKFVDAKTYSNRWDAERDRLRTFIQQHISSGRYGKFILEKTTGTPRVTSTSLGNQLLQNGVVLDAGLIHKPIKGGTKVTLVGEAGEILLEAVVVANSTLFNKNPPTNLKLTEVPADDSTKP